MNIVEKIWVMLGLAIIFLILITDPKNTTNSIGNNKVTRMFASITEEQKFVQKITWVFIGLFLLLTIYTY
jgi:protein translocase SecG subunit